MGTKSKFKKLPKTNKAKAKRWKKGHSSTSNPENSRFREAARNRFFAKSEGPSSLTVDALAKHDQDEASHDAVSMATDSDTQTLGTMGTFKTWATNWTDCTNTTFSKVHRYWSSNNASHKEILAVLAAVTEVIKTEGGTESETEYFAALMTALESTEEVESVAAIVYLISLVLKKVPVPVLRSKFSEVAKCFLELLGNYADSDNTSLVKSLLTSLSFLLRAQEHAVWNVSSTQQVYKGLLTFVTHKKPKMRKAAQDGVCIILQGSLFMLETNGPAHHPAAAMTTKHCVQVIEACGGTGEAADTLHMLGLLRRILPVLPQSSIKSACEMLLRLMTLSNVMVTAGCMQAFHSLLSAAPSATNLPTDLNAQIISALYDFQPSENDVQPTIAWLTVMEAAHGNLAKLDEKLCISHLPRIFSAGMVCLLSVRTEITQAATKALKSLISRCISPVAEQLRSVIKAATEKSPSSIHKVLKVLESGLSYQFHSSWGLVLQLFASIYTSLGKQAPSLFKKSLAGIADLRDSTRFSYKAEVDHAMGCAVKTMGPKFVLTAVPLQITGQSDDLDFPRSWLLPVLRNNIMDTELSFFISYFLPLSAKLRQRSLELSDQQNLVASRTYEALQSQIWSLLPGFCTRPTDLAVSFKGVAKVLGTAISERDDLRMEVMASLRKLVNQSITNAESRTELSRFAKNFLPILFNLMTTDPVKAKDPSKLAVFETIKCYYQITDKALIATYCEKCRERLQEVGISAYKRSALYDLLIAMIPYLEQNQLKLVFNTALEQLQDMDKTVQKKSYRMLEELCATTSAEGRKFVADNLSTLQSEIVSALSSSSPSSKAPRLKCLILIFQQLDSRQDDFLLAVVPEAILCTKEIAERARSSAYTLLIEMGNAVIRWGHADGKDVLAEYLKMVMGGFAGSPHMISCTLLALTRILYQFKGQISSDMLESIIENVCLLLKSKAREVVQSALAFTKVLLSAYPVTILAQFLKPIMSSLVSMKTDCHHHFRFKSKEIYAKLMRKFGYETIYGMTPDSIRKVLVNIKKTQERNKKKKKANDGEEEEESDDEQEQFKTQPDSIDDLLKDSDSEMEDDSADKKKSKKGKKEAKKEGKKEGKTGNAWLQETGDDITDFMDMSASKKVMATKPVEKAKKKEDGGFKTASDGRLIITESSDEDGDSDEEDIDDLLSALDKGGNAGKIKQKTKKRKIDELGDSDDEASSAPKYKAGGKGIHRPLGKPAKSDYGSEYKAKKAKGDVKKSGKHDPYAYVPLNMGNLNKRKQSKAKGQFTSLVRGAKKGAQKGKKSGKKKQ